MIFAGRHLRVGGLRAVAAGHPLWINAFDPVKIFIAAGLAEIERSELYGEKILIVPQPDLGQKIEVFARRPGFVENPKSCNGEYRRFPVFVIVVGAQRIETFRLAHKNFAASTPTEAFVLEISIGQTIAFIKGLKSLARGIESRNAFFGRNPQSPVRRHGQAVNTVKRETIFDGKTRKNGIRAGVGRYLL